MRDVRRLRGVLAALAVTCVASAVAAPHALGHPEGCGKDGDEADAVECFTAEEIAGFDDSGATLAPNQLASSPNMRLLANVPKSGPMAGTSNFGSDIAFQGRYAYMGNYNGFQVVDIAEPERPVVVSQVLCPGSQNDISVYGNLLFTSTDSGRAFAECERDGQVNTPLSPTVKESWEGIRVFDISNPAAPRYVTGVETDCGSHTHTLIPDLANGRHLLYVSSYGPSADFPDCQPPHDKISIVAVPVNRPQDASVIAEPVLFPDGGFPGDAYTRATSGCHDITAYPAKGIAAGACMGQGVLLDISNPENPVVTESVTDPNFAFWHSATFSHDADTVIFTDELGGGGGPTCNPTVGPDKGADGIYTIAGGKLTRRSYFKIARTQTNHENCVAHNGNLLPRTDRDVFVQAWYQGGTAVIDFTDPARPVELGFLERGEFRDASGNTGLGGAWSSYWYNGRIYVNDIQMGLDVIGLADRAAAKSGRKVPRLNAQTQEPPLR